MVKDVSGSNVSRQRLETRPVGYPTWDGQFSSPHKKKYGDMGDDHYRIQSGVCNSPSRIDSRIVMLLEFFREMYFRRSELFKKLFPGSLHDEFVSSFEKFGSNILSLGKSEQGQKIKTLQRSLSVGSPRGIPGDDGRDELRLERFKVRTVVPGLGVPPGLGQDDQDGKNPGGSKSK